MPWPQERDASHLYPIQSEPSYFFFAGTTPHGQVLMGLACPYLVAYYFDSEGNLTGGDRRCLDFLRPSGVYAGGEPIPEQVQTYNVYDDRIPILLQEWQREMGFREQSIRVKRFADSEFGIGIRDYPEHFSEVMSDPETTEEEKANELECESQWEADGQFVLWWGNDYWLNGEGEVTSS
jgi:hypothetical protein